MTMKTNGMCMYRQPVVYKYIGITQTHYTDVILHGCYL